jgi:hypothetical protein
MNMAISILAVVPILDDAATDSIPFGRSELFILILSMFFVVPIILIAFLAQRLAKWMSR